MGTKIIDTRELRFSEKSFRYLMQSRIYNILIVCSNYEYYMLEEDGRIDEQVFKEYVSLNLSNPPRFIHASTPEIALQLLQNEQIDLIITMYSIGTIDIYKLTSEIKSTYPKIPIVVLTPFSREVFLKVHKGDLSSIDYVFCWLGNLDILLAIIKLIEDKMNVEQDVENVGVQIILLVEDSIRFYSSYLPIMYKIILKQSRFFMTEGLNDYIERMRMRGRPKILLAINYEEALRFYEKYYDNMLGIISDISYKRNGQVDLCAGIRLCEKVRENDKFLPFLLQSSDNKNFDSAHNLNASFLSKSSKTLSYELETYLSNNLAFGDFVFRDPGTFHELGRASNLGEIQKVMHKIPHPSLKYHFSRNDLSRWLNARALFPIAKMLKGLSVNDFEDMHEAITFLDETIAQYRQYMGRGVIAEFESIDYDEYILFARIGQGSLGGKARGLAFIDSFLKRNEKQLKFKSVEIKIPRSVVLCTDIFDEFMQSNNLYHFVKQDIKDEAILHRFLQAKLPDYVTKHLQTILSVINKPLAIRSSSLLEDSHYQPFAGVYSTYMIPNNTYEKQKTLQMLIECIKCVYASVFYESSKSYMEATKNLIDEEKMAIVIQEICGTEHEGQFYPTLSGIARSINFYPISPEKPRDGIAKIAVGLGKIIVEGGQCLRFSPRYPKKILQLSSVDSSLNDTQQYIYSLNLSQESFSASTDDGINIKKHRIRQIKDKGTLKHVASTYDVENNIIRPGINFTGKRIISFEPILQYNSFPLADILCQLLELGQREMNSPIEIEFAADLSGPDDIPKTFYFLQIRPIVENSDDQKVSVENYKTEDVLLVSDKALGNGVIRDIYDVVYVKPESFDASKNIAIAKTLGKINNQFIKDDRNYILIGPGRWGSQDPWLGVPVKWGDISAARVIVESGLENYRIDPSQGTHFFQNLTSFRIGYFTINPYNNDGIFNIEFLNTIPPVYEDSSIRHIRVNVPMIVKIDGRTHKGVIFKPDPDQQNKIS